MDLGITKVQKTVDSNYLEAVYQQQFANPNPMTYFKALVAPENPLLEKIMGSLHGNITPERFSSFCQSFAEGLEYVRDKYKTQPAGIVIIDEEHSPSQSGAFYNQDTHVIFITREYIKTLIDFGMSIQGKTTPFLLNANEMAMMVGVEEAFHAHQFTSNPSHYHVLSLEQHERGVTILDKNNYENAPIEREAILVVHQAMIDTGMVHTAPLAISNVTPKSMEWAIPFMKERTVVRNNIQTHDIPKSNIPSNDIKPFSSLPSSPLPHVVSISAQGAVLQTPALQPQL